VDGIDFDRLARFLISRVNRRRVGHGLGATLVGLSGIHASTGAKTRKLERNQYGCVNVGNPCRGRDGVCCSGICKGRKPKRGEKDRSRCVAHDADVCEGGEHTPGCGGTAVACTTSTGASGRCMTTTGNAGYCGEGFSYVCNPCRRDADCQRDAGPESACIRCTACPEGTACAFA
jgi:hypothetical protein